MVGPLGDTVEFPVAPPVVLVPERDGVRIISDERHELLRRVPAPLADVYRVGSTTPGDTPRQCTKLTAPGSGDLLRQVPAPLADVYRVGSTTPGVAPRQSRTAFPEFAALLQWMPADIFQREVDPMWFHAAQ